MKLGISIITYNRAAYLKHTLEVLHNSVLKDFSIIVIDNCSSDNSVEVAKGFKDKLSNLTVISNKVNVGGDANIMRAIELCGGDYSWILCDDDEIDLTSFNEVLEIIEEAKVDLIHVGAHPEPAWHQFGGNTYKAKSLITMGYPYFKFSSFIPCNIFKSSAFTIDFVHKGYRNIVFSYPHMPFLIALYEKDSPVYISKNQIVTATLGSSNYALSNFYYWWIGTCKLLASKKDVRIAFLDQWKTIERTSPNEALDVLISLLKNGQNKPLIKNFIQDYLLIEDRYYIFKKRTINSIVDKLRLKMATVKIKFIKMLTNK